MFDVFGWVGGKERGTWVGLGWMWMTVDIPFNECTSINASLSYLSAALDWAITQSVTLR